MDSIRSVASVDAVYVDLFATLAGGYSREFKEFHVRSNVRNSWLRMGTVPLVSVTTNPLFNRGLMPESYMWNFLEGINVVKANAFSFVQGRLIYPSEMDYSLSRHACVLEPTDPHVYFLPSNWINQTRLNPIATSVNEHTNVLTYFQSSKEGRRKVL